MRLATTRWEKLGVGVDEVVFPRLQGSRNSYLTKERAATRAAPTTCRRVGRARWGRPYDVQASRAGQMGPPLRRAGESGRPQGPPLRRAGESGGPDSAAETRGVGGVDEVGDDAVGELGVGVDEMVFSTASRVRKLVQDGVAWPSRRWKRACGRQCTRAWGRMRGKREREYHAPISSSFSRALMLKLPNWITGPGVIPGWRALYSGPLTRFLLQKKRNSGGSGGAPSFRWSDRPARALSFLHGGGPTKVWGESEPNSSRYWFPRGTPGSSTSGSSTWTRREIGFEPPAPGS